MIQPPQTGTGNGNKASEVEKEHKTRNGPSTRKDAKGKGPRIPSKK